MDSFTKYCFLLLAISLVFLGWSCQKNPVTPKDLEPGRRDYVWTVDTLEMPMNDVRCVWGATPQDVWAVGPGGTEEDRLWHYDGTTWSAYTQETIWCTGTTLYGFSTDNVWMGGGAGWEAPGAALWHYDGTAWQRHTLFNVPGAWDVQITNIWGTDPSNIYACGIVGYYDGIESWFQGLILHYDGSNWNKVTQATWESKFLRIRQERQGIYIQSFGKQDTIAFYALWGNSLEEIYSLSEQEEEYGSLYDIDGEIYFILTKDVYQYRDGEFQRQFALHYPEFGYQIFGRHMKDIFVRMRDGLAHYNGTDLQYLYKFPLESQASISPSPVLFEAEVFFPVWAPGLAKPNMILHGTLKEEKRMP